MESDIGKLSRLEERINHMPTKEHIGSVRSEMLTALDRAMDRIDTTLEKHERSTSERVHDTVTKTVEAAFNLQWQKIETAIAQKIPDKQKPDWKPYALMALMAVVFGVEKVIPAVLKWAVGG